MTAITQYLYHYFTIKDNNEEIAKTLEQISIVEMHHLEILAELIIKLGDNPIYCSQNSYWSGNCVKYGYNLYDKLISDLNDEYEAIEHYQYHISLIDDPYIKEILQRIILDEEVHIKILTDIINKLEQN